MIVAFDTRYVSLGEKQLKPRGIEGALLVQELHIRGMLSGGGIQFSSTWTTSLGEAPGVPSTQDTDPGAIWRGGRSADSSQPFLQRTDLVPSDCVPPCETRSEKMEVRVDETRDGPSSLEIQQPGSVPNGVVDLLAGPGCNDAAVPHTH
jgi:hypothetical protein